MIGKVFLAATHEIAKNTRNVETVKAAMKRIMKITNNMTHSLYVVDLLKKQKRIGTNAIEHLLSHKFSYLLSNVVDELCSGETVCNSTEEMLSSIQKCNERGIEEGDVVGSADVKSLYPSIPVDDAIDVVAAEFERKGMKVEGIDYEELGCPLLCPLFSGRFLPPPDYR